MDRTSTVSDAPKSGIWRTPEPALPRCYHPDVALSGLRQQEVPKGHRSPPGLHRQQRPSPAWVQILTIIDDSSQRVCHETIYQYIYAHPAGALKKLLVDALRKGHQKRRPRSRGKDRRGGIKNMRSIRERPEETQSREVPGHWEGDLIKGAFNGSAIGTLVDRSTRFVILAKVGRCLRRGRTGRLLQAPAHAPQGLEEDADL